MFGRHCLNLATVVPTGCDDGDITVTFHIPIAGPLGGQSGGPVGGVTAVSERHRPASVDSGWWWEQFTRQGGVFLLLGRRCAAPVPVDLDNLAVDDNGTEVSHVVVWVRVQVRGVQVSGRMGRQH